MVVKTATYPSELVDAFTCFDDEKLEVRRYEHDNTYCVTVPEPVHVTVSAHAVSKDVFTVSYGSYGLEVHYDNK